MTRDARYVFVRAMPESEPQILDTMGVGPAPRTLSAERRAVLFRWHKNLYALWVILTVMSLLPLLVVALIAESESIALGVWAQSLVWPALFGFLAYRAWAARKLLRDRLVETYENGELLMGEIGNVHVLYRGRFPTYDIEVHLPNGKTARVIAADSSVDIVAVPNMRVEALWYAKYPDVVIPTLTLPTEY